MQRTPSKAEVAPEWQGLAMALRLPTAGRLDCVATAQSLGVKLHYDDLGGLGGVCRTSTDIALDRRLSPEHQRIVFAHELGHLILRRDLLIGALSWADEELFADHFGDELALPRVELATRSASAPSRLADEYGIPLSRVVAQLARLGSLPRVTRLSSGEIVCARCAERKRRGCRCLYYRMNPDEARALPTIAAA